MSKVLMVISGADSLTLADGSVHPTGYWAEEVAASHRVFTEAGVEVVLATPGGVRPTVDALSLDERGGVSSEDAQTFRAYLDGLADGLAHPLPLAQLNGDDYDAIYLPGGHGPMADLVGDADLGRLLNAAQAEGKTVAALCHGVAALLSATGQDGAFTFAGRTVTSFTDEEERQGGLGDDSPYFVESLLRERGAVLQTGAAWSDTVVRDGNLVTGQNPQSSVSTARAVLKGLLEG
ncbi:type 1 glutamine amidotransferase domain-containing protein [Actinocorallia populi]|uniref:type 1 glutamine amidotransferase domain-containing protein n=1 Tax=Actinocorallia populi TaxID=2079200 RepID=UPI000D089912|nr:type 1 glutamine amidotransferase domain-containing protein [Actinocorallia populi]